MRPWFYQEKSEKIMARKASTNKAPSRTSKKFLEAQKAIRTLSDVENFYTFVHENDLREEAKILLETIARTTKKSSRSKKILQ